MPGLALGLTIIAGSARADVTAVYGCRFYVDGKVYAEFRINEIDHTEWDEVATFDPPDGKPFKADVMVRENAGEDEKLRFQVDRDGIEIVVADTLDFENARYFGPKLKNLAGECEQADSPRALVRWFQERERQRRRRR